MKGCKHIYPDGKKESTLEIFDIETMESPKKKYTFCNICNASIVFEERCGRYKKIKEERDADI